MFQDIAHVNISTMKSLAFLKFNPEGTSADAILGKSGAKVSPKKLQFQAINHYENQIFAFSIASIKTYFLPDDCIISIAEFIYNLLDQTA